MKRKRLKLSTKLYALTFVLVMSLLLLSLVTRNLEVQVGHAYTPVSAENGVSIEEEVPEGYQEVTINKGSISMRFVTNEDKVVSKLGFLEALYVITPVLAVLMAIVVVSAAVIAMKEKQGKYTK